MGHDERVTVDDGTAIAVTLSGEGPPLILIPGLGSTRRVYAPIVPALERHHRVVVYDPRGVGDSDVPPGPYPMERLAADCVAVAAWAGAERFDLFGASMGGMVAEHVAVLHGDRLRRLILAATGPGRYGAVPPEPEANAALLGRGARSPEEAYRIACSVLYSERFQTSRPGFIDAEVAYRGAHPVKPAAFTAQLRSSRGSDISQRLGEIRVPTLIMHGTEDRLMPVENARLLAKAIPGARHYFFEGCGHLFFHEEPQRSAEVILSFLRD